MSVRMEGMEGKKRKEGRREGGKEGRRERGKEEKKGKREGGKERVERLSAKKLNTKLLTDWVHNWAKKH